MYVRKQYYWAGSTSENNIIELEASNKPFLYLFINLHSWPASKWNMAGGYRRPFCMLFAPLFVFSCERGILIQLPSPWVFTVVLFCLYTRLIVMFWSPSCFQCITVLQSIYFYPFSSFFLFYSNNFQFRSVHFPVYQSSDSSDACLPCSNPWPKVSSI